MTGKLTIGLSGLVAALFMLTGSVSGVYMWPSVIEEQIEQARDSIKGVHMCEFQQAVEKADYDMIIDVREGEEYAAGHIAGAINIPRGLLEFEIWKHVGYPGTIDTTKKIYVYCRDGRRAILCAKTLQDLGFSNVAAIVMELNEWPFSNVAAIVMELNEWPLAGGKMAAIEGAVEFESDPSDYNKDYGGT
jgi:rhodanese-related sulfurtransferase